MTLSTSNFKRIIYLFTIIGVIIFYYTVDSSKPQSVLGDLRLSVYEASKLSNSSVDTLFLGTSITNRALHSSSYKKVAFPGHTVIDGLNFILKRNINAEYIVVELNLIDSKPKGLSVIDKLMKKPLLNVSVRLSDKLIGWIYEKIYSSTLFDPDESKLRIKNNYSPNRDMEALVLLKEKFAKERIIFLSIPMHESKEDEYFIREKESLLSNLGYKVLIPRFNDLNTTDGLHMTQESAEIFSKKLKLDDIPFR